MDRSEWPAGDGQLLVLYQPEDTGDEIDPATLYAWIASDAAHLAAAEGLRIVTMTATSLRHSATAFGREGSGYQTKVAVAVVYHRPTAA